MERNRAFKRSVGALEPSRFALAPARSCRARREAWPKGRKGAGSSLPAVDRPFHAFSTRFRPHSGHFRPLEHLFSALSATLYDLTP